MRRFEFEQLVAIVRRESRGRADPGGTDRPLTLAEELSALRGLGELEEPPRQDFDWRRWEPSPRIKELVKPILRRLGVYEPVRAWVRARRRSAPE